MLTSLSDDLVEKITILFLFYCTLPIVVVLINNVEQKGVVLCKCFIIRLLVLLAHDTSRKEKEVNQ
jgi:hypothetical protein